MLVRNRIKQCANPRLVIVQAKIGGSQDWNLVSPAFEEIGKNADQVAGFLGIGCHQHLIF